MFCFLRFIKSETHSCCEEMFYLHTQTHTGACKSKNCFWALESQTALRGSLEKEVKRVCKLSGFCSQTQQRLIVRVALYLPFPGRSVT